MADVRPTIGGGQAPLAGQVALVTGGSRGIGRGCALALAEAGADVCVNYRASEVEAQEAVAAIRAMGRNALAVKADVSDRDQAAYLVEEAERKLGPISILVANAVYSHRAPFLEIPFEEVEKTMRVSAFGAFHVCQFTAQRMAARGKGGSIIVIGSPHSHVPFVGAIDYNMAKAAVHHMAMTMAAELVPHRIRVNIIEPGWIDTPGERKWTPDDVIYRLGSQLPWGRLGRPEDIGRAAVFLASPENDYVSGTVLRVDGALVVSLQGTRSFKE